MLSNTLAGIDSSRHIPGCLDTIKFQLFRNCGSLNNKSFLVLLFLADFRNTNINLAIFSFDYQNKSTYNVCSDLNGIHRPPYKITRNSWRSRDLTCHQITFEDFTYFFRADMSHIAVPLDPACHVILVIFWILDRGVVRSARFTTLITFHTHLLLLNLRYYEDD